MPSTRRSPGRIFINYRRDDSGGTAGRLSDSLSRYFGPGRVFRDIEGIEAGSNFEDVLRHTADQADAMIVLIGQRWTQVKNEQGHSRLHEPQDWVAREIASALERQIPIYPVLVESAVMPRRDELPVSLQALARHNAISISDQRWSADVVRLARIVAMDIPGSLAERTLMWVQRIVSLALVMAVAWPTLLILANHLSDRAPLLLRWQSGVAFVTISACVAVLLFYARLIDPAARWWIYAACAAGLLGTFGCFMWAGGMGIEHRQLPLAMFGGSTLTASTMLALMGLSRFRAK